jgi:hypothetical protein
VVSIGFFVIGNDGPESVKFPVLAEQVLPAHFFRRNIPYSHKYNLEANLREVKVFCSAGLKPLLQIIFQYPGSDIYYSDTYLQLPGKI